MSKWNNYNYILHKIKENTYIYFNKSKDDFITELINENNELKNNYYKLKYDFYKLKNENDNDNLQELVSLQDTEDIQKNENNELQKLVSILDNENNDFIII